MWQWPKHCEVKMLTVVCCDRHDYYFEHQSFSWLLGRQTEYINLPLLTRHNANTPNIRLTVWKNAPSLMCYWAYVIYTVTLKIFTTQITENMQVCRGEENIHTQTHIKRYMRSLTISHGSKCLYQLINRRQPHSSNCSNVRKRIWPFMWNKWKRTPN